MENLKKVKKAGLFVENCGGEEKKWSICRGFRGDEKREIIYGKLGGRTDCITISEVLGAGRVYGTVCGGSGVE